jgi:hypothetical protein
MFRFIACRRWMMKTTLLIEQRLSSFDISSGNQALSRIKAGACLCLVSNKSTKERCRFTASHLSIVQLETKAPVDCY